MSWLFTVSASWGSGTMCSQPERKLIPVKMTAKQLAITTSTRRALRLSGGLKAATPSAMASVPVRPTAPEAKARSTSSRLRACTPSAASRAASLEGGT